MTRLGEKLAELGSSPLLTELAHAYQQALAIKLTASGLSLVDALRSGDNGESAAANMEIAKLEGGIQDLVVQDPRFPGNRALMLRRNNGAIGFYPRFVSAPLIRRALLNDSPEDAITWLTKVLGTSAAAGKAVYILWGVPVVGEVDLCKSVKIVPIELLPDSANMRPPSNARLLTLKLANAVSFQCQNALKNGGLWLMATSCVCQCAMAQRSLHWARKTKLLSN